MPDEDDRFGDVAEQLKQTSDETTSDSEVETQRTTGSTLKKSESAETRTTSQTEDDGQTQSGPAFSFDETEMHGFYVRNETWNRVTQMRSSVTAACSVFDVPEFEGREFQDACLRVIAEHGDEVALQILRERGIDPDEQRVADVVEMLENSATVE